MRKAFLICVLLAASAPAHAQSTSGASSSVNISNPANIESKTRLITPPPVGAPGLAAAGVETCLGSATGGLSIMGGGLTFGRTYPDEGCNIRLAARQLHAFGYPRAALALMCQDPRVAEAMAAVGQPCPSAAELRMPRRRVAEDVTGSIRVPSADRRAGSKRKPAAWFKAPPGAVVVPWKNPDDPPRRTTFAFLENAYGAFAQALSFDVAAAANADEERWFARATSSY